MQDASINTGFPLSLNWLELVCGLKNPVTNILPMQQVLFLNGIYVESSVTAV